MALAALSAGATPLTWDASPTLASPGPNDGNGIWGASTGNTNWWNGTANVSWNNANAYSAVLGANTASACTVTLTNNITVSGLTYSNARTGVYTIGGSTKIDIQWQCAWLSGHRSIPATTAGPLELAPSFCPFCPLTLSGALRQ